MVFWVVFERENESFELCCSLASFWKFIEIHLEFGRTIRWWTIHQSECVFDELVVEAKEGAFHLILSQAHRLMHVLAEHDPHFQIALCHLIKKEFCEVLVF